MLTKTDSLPNLLDALLNSGALAVSFLSDGQWIPITDRRILYEIALDQIIQSAKDDGFKVTRQGDWEDTPIEMVRLDEWECNGLGDGCTCPCCTAQIEAVAGTEGGEA